LSIQFSAAGILGSSAETLANKQSNAAALTARVPACVSQLQVNPEGATKLKACSALKSE
jgi:hypothetical protein